jgi:hypothetical protein
MPAFTRLFSSSRYDLLEIRRIAFLIGPCVPLGERRHGRTSVLRDRRRSPASREPRLRKLNVVIDGSIIRRPSLLRSVLLPRGPDKKGQQRLLRTLRAREHRQRLTILENPTHLTTQLLAPRHGHCFRLLIERKFCTVRQTCVKSAHHRLGMGNFPDIAVPRDLGRGFRNGGLI